MKTALLILLILTTLSPTVGWSQTFPVTGQLASTAFPVCGTKTFVQSTVPIGSTHLMAVPGCGNGYPDTNPFWYEFTCYVGGTLGFVITPNSLGDDYDWQLYDITGHSPNDVYTDPALVVIGNWSGTYGLTGARAGGVSYIQCASFPADDAPTFSAMPILIQGHTYLLLVSHYTESQSGYTLTFTGGTASITDPTLPKLSSATISCDRKQITVFLNKQMRCSSLAGNGSDFNIDSLPNLINSATGLNCSSGFDMDTVLILLGSPLAAGSYHLTMQVGTDSNTLLDNCGNQIPPGFSVPLIVTLPQPTLMDSLTPVGCAPNSLELVFSKPMQCSSIAPDGSEFALSGPLGPRITSASGNCANGLSSVINLTLSSPIVVGGSYALTLVTGSTGTGLTDVCGLQTPGATLSFMAQDTVSASFSYSVDYGCQVDTIQVSYSPLGGVDQWRWNFSNGVTSTALDTTIQERIFGPVPVEHIVSNGTCSDTVNGVVNLTNALKAAFKAPDQVCPKTAVQFADSSIGNITSYSWNFGDGTNSDQADPPDHQFPNTSSEVTYNVTLTVQNNFGCQDTASLQITKLQSCYITVPNAFTPNGDGKNDYLYPLNAFKATNLEFRVFNRYGQLVFESRDWMHRWDGTLNGVPQDMGTYVWTLKYTDGDSGKQFFQKGTTVLIR